MAHSRAALCIEAIRKWLCVRMKAYANIEKKKRNRFHHPGHEEKTLFNGFYIEPIAIEAANASLIQKQAR